MKSGFLWKTLVAFCVVTAPLIGHPYPGVCDDRPAFKYRWMGTDKWAPEHYCNVNIPKEYQKKRENYYQIWGSYDALGQLLPTEKYFKTHPEYFSLHNHKRIPAQFSLSNPDVRRIVADNLIAVIRESSGLDIVTLGLQDNRFICHFQKYCNNYPISDPGSEPNARFREIIAGWRSLAKKLFIYEYYYEINWLGADSKWHLTGRQ